MVTEHVQDEIPVSQYLAKIEAAGRRRRLSIASLTILAAVVSFGGLFVTMQRVGTMNAQLRGVFASESALESVASEKAALPAPLMAPDPAQPGIKDQESELPSEMSAVAP